MTGCRFDFRRRDWTCPGCRLPGLTVRALPDGAVRPHCPRHCQAGKLLGILGLSWLDVGPLHLRRPEVAA
jgi:hypothetical protein